MLVVCGERKWKFSVKASSKWRQRSLGDLIEQVADRPEFVCILPPGLVVSASERAARFCSSEVRVLDQATARTVQRTARYLWGETVCAKEWAEDAKFFDVRGWHEDALQSWFRSQQSGCDFKREIATCAKLLLSTSFRPRPDHIFITSFPKSGTTWAQSIVLHLVTGHAPTDPITQAPWLEAAIATRHTTFQELQRTTCTVFKTHATPANLFPAATSDFKLIVVTRNPKDVCCSLYHHRNALVHQPQVDWEAHVAQFADGKIDDAGAGDWFDWTFDWATQTVYKNVYWLHYEALAQRPETEIRDLARFLGVALTDQLLADILEKSSFDNMKRTHEALDISHATVSSQRRPGASPHFRCGRVGDWRNAFTADQSALFDHLYQQRFVDRLGTKSLPTGGGFRAFHHFDPVPTPKLSSA